MAWAHIASRTLGANINNPGSSWNTGNLSGALSLGDRMFAAVDVNWADSNPQPSVTGITDSLSNVWTKIGAIQHHFTSGGTYNEELSMWTTSSAAGTPSNITVAIDNNLSTNSGAGIAVDTFSGLNTTTSPVDIFRFDSTAFGNGTAQDSGTTSGTTSGANELKIACVSDGGANTTYGAGTSDTTYTLGATNHLNLNSETDIEYADSGSSGSTARATFTSGISSNWLCGVAVIKLPGSGANFKEFGAVLASKGLIKYMSPSLRLGVLQPEFNIRGLLAIYDPRNKGATLSSVLPFQPVSYTTTTRFPNGTLSGAPTNPWANMGNAFSNNAAYATGTSAATSSVGDSQWWDTFGFDSLIPANAVVTKAEVIVRMMASRDDDQCDIDVSIVTNINDSGAILAGKARAAEQDYIVDVLSLTPFSGPGGTGIGSEFYDANLEVAVQGFGPPISGPSIDWSLNSVSMRLTWHAPSVPAVLIKQTRRPIPATASFVGAAFKQVRRALPATVSFVGAMFKQTQRVLAATLSFIGNVATVFTPGFIQKALFATLSFAGSIVKQTNKPLPATLSLVGTVTKFTSRALAATLPLIGATLKSTSRTLAATLSFVGSLLRGPVFRATLTFATAMTKSTSRTFAAMLSFVGATIRNVRRSFVAALTFSKPYSLVVLEDAPLLYWRLGESVGTTAVDSSGASRSGTYAGSPTLGATGYTRDGDTAVTFDGIDDQVSRASDPALMFPGSFTLEGVFKSADFSASSTPRILSKEAVNGADGYNVQAALTGTRPTLFFRTVGMLNPADSNPNMISAMTLDLNVRYHFACVWDGTTKYMYINGVLDTSYATTGTTLTTNTAAFVLANTASGGRIFKGDIDEVALYATALSPQRIATHYAGLNSPALPAFLFKQTARLLAGLQTFAGAVTTLKAFGRLLQATLSFVGSQSKFIGKPQAATLPLIGTTTKQTSRPLAATLALLGSVFKQTRRALAATLSFVGTTTTLKAFTALLVATLAFVGSQTKQISRTLPATLPLVGATTKLTRRALAATSSFIGTLTKQTNRLIAAILSFVGTMNTLKAFTALLVATLSFIGSQTKRTNKALPATQSFVGATTRAITRPLAATLSFVGAAFKRVPRNLAATLSFVGSTAASHQVFVTLVATAQFVGATTKRTGKAANATLSFVGTITQRAVGKALAATVALAGSAFRKVSQTRGSTVGLIGATFKQGGKTFAGLVSFVGAESHFRLVVSFTKFLFATVAFSGVAQRRISHGLVSTLGLHGTAIGRSIKTILFTATLSFVGFWSRVIRLGKFPVGRATYQTYFHATTSASAVFAGATSYQRKAS